MEFIDLKEQYRVLKKEIDENIQAVLTETNFIMGEQITVFEERLAQYVDMKYAISCASGTDALQLIYMAYGIGKGDVVFCPDMTFIASVEPACLLGAVPVFCDIDRHSYNICPQSLEKQIKHVLKEGKLIPRMIVAVDFIGNPAQYDELQAIASKYQMILVEDAAQGIGASYKGRKCGSFGDIAATSFFPSKPLGCYGDGGAVFTNDSKMKELMCSYRIHGKGTSKYDNIRIGMNSRLDTLQAAIMLPKLACLNMEISRRQQLAKRYHDALGHKFVIPHIDADSISTYAQYALLAEDTKQRDDIREFLESEGIPSIVYYPNPLHAMKVFENRPECRGAELFENTIEYAGRTFSIPFSAYLTEENQDRVIDVLLRI